MREVRTVGTRCAGALGRLALVMGSGTLMLVGVGVGGGAASATAPVLRMLPSHLLGPVATTARTASTSNVSPCWASSNWSGYALSQAAVSGLPCVPASGATYTAVTGTWKVPTVTGSRRSATYSAAWTGIDGFTNANLIQAGTEQDYYGGSAHYTAWWEILPAPETVIPSMVVKPGDIMIVSIVKGVPNWTITVTDTTSGKAFSTSQPYAGAGTSAEWVYEAPQVNGRIATLAHYGSTVFDHGTANTVSPHLTAGSGGEMVQGYYYGQVVSVPSGPDTGAPVGDGFTSAYGSSIPPAPTS